MTREEKSKAIEKYCVSRGACSDTPKCPLSTVKGLCYTEDADIDRNYDILVKAGCIKDEAHERFMGIGEKTVNYPQMAHAPGNATSEFTAIHNTVNHPNHYTRGGIECIAAIKASMTSDGFCDYCKGNIIKYLWRWRDKGGLEDLHKARVYLDWLIEEMKGANNAET